MATSRRIAGIFPIGDPAEGEFVVAEWHPDPQVMEVDILRMADEFDDWLEPMEQVREIIIQDTQEHFDFERDPFGRKWIPLDETYAKDKAKAGFPDQILIRSDDMREAAISEDAWFMDERDIMFNVGALPVDEEGRVYGAAHQEGSSKAVTTYHRIMRNLTLSETEGVQLFGRPLTSQQESFIAKHETPEGRGRNLPQREFIGMSEQAINAAEEVFLEYIHTHIEEEWEDMGMGSNVLGEFPIIGYTIHDVPILRTPQGPRFGRK